MDNVSNDAGGNTLTGNDENGLDARIFRVMAAAIALAVIVSTLFSPWRVATGLLLGGLLSLLNHYWLRTSIAAVFSPGLAGNRPKIKVSRYLLRYLVIGTVVYSSYKLNLVSLPATIAGLCSFVIAILAEALREAYHSIIRREEIS